MKIKHAFWLLLAVTCMTFLPFLGETLFYSKGEPREAIVAVSMLQQGNWILPVSNGDMIPYKPPFMAWCIAAVSLPWGHVSEYTSRLPSAVALIVMVMWVFMFYARRVGSGRALLTAMVTFTAFEVYRAGFACRVDMILTLFIVGAILSLYTYWERGMKGVPWLAVLMMTGAFLTKGPVGVVLPCGVMGLFMLLRGERFWKVFGLLLLWGIASCIIPALWYVAAFQQGGEQFRELMYEENIGRMTGTMSYDSHLNPWWYNLLTLVLGFLPYTLVVLMSLFVIFRIYRFRKAEAGFWRAFMCMDAVNMVSLISFLAILFFYCIPASKRSVYLLPVYPFVAFFLSGYLLYLARNSRRVLKVYCGVLAVAAVAVFAAFVVIQCGAFPYGVLKGKHALENAMFVTGLSQHTPVVKWLLAEIPVIIGVLALVRLRRMSGRFTLLAAVGLTITLYWAFAGVYQPAVLNTKSDKKIASVLLGMQPAGPVYAYTDNYNTRFYGVNYYLDDRLKHIDAAPAGESGYVIMTVDDGKEYLPAHSDRYDFYLLRHFKTRSCDLRRQVLLLKFVPRK